jgi:DNA polymerase-1
VAAVLDRYDRPLVAHNLLFDSKMLKKDGLTIPQHLAHDSMIMCHLLDAMAHQGLKPAAARYVDKRAWAGQDALKKTFNNTGYTWATIPEDHPAYWVYSALDTVLTSALAEKIYPDVAASFGNIYEIELACIHTLRDAELRGMAIDLEYCADTTRELQFKLAELAPQIPVTNPRADAQVIAFLQSRGYEFWKKTEKGNWSCDDDVLSEASEFIPEAELLRKYRKAYKLLTSYFYNFKEEHVDGVVHPSIKPTGARTGRMSVTNPALQTLPRGRIVRDAFIAREGCTLVLADYRQAEYRVFASMAREPKMIEAFLRGEDLHDFLAKSAYGEDFTKEQRQTAKNANFSKVYCAGEEQFARTAKISVPDAHAFLERYDAMFPRVAAWQQEVMQEVHASAKGGVGYVTTALGRRLPVELKKAYKGVNYKVQPSVTADVLKKKIVELDHAGLGDFILLPVHDEIIFEVPDDDVPAAVQVIEEVMPDRQTFAVPLEIDLETARRWGDTYAD